MNDARSRRPELNAILLARALQEIVNLAVASNAAAKIDLGALLADNHVVAVDAGRHGGRREVAGHELQQRHLGGSVLHGDAVDEQQAADVVGGFVDQGDQVAEGRVVQALLVDGPGPVREFVDGQLPRLTRPDGGGAQSEVDADAGVGQTPTGRGGLRTAALGERLAEQFVEVLFAPGYDEEALEALKRKPGTRILDDRERRRGNPGERDYKRVLGGLLVQDRDWEIEDRENMIAVCGEPSESQWGDMLFAWRVCKHVTSNAIVLARGLHTIGVGAGQMSRVDAVRIAVDKARELGHELGGAALASDAFFPFADGPQLALEAGVRAVIQPGGSKRDAEVIEAASSAGAAMVFTGRRHFKH